MLELDGVEAGYGSAQVLFGVSFSVNAGACVSLMGMRDALACPWFGVAVDTLDMPLLSVSTSMCVADDPDVALKLVPDVLYWRPGSSVTVNVTVSN